MQQFLKQHRFFITCFFVYLFLGSLILFYFQKVELIEWIDARRFSFLNFFFKNITYLGSGFMVAVFMIIGFFYHWRYTIGFGLAGILSAIVVGTIKFFFPVARPAVDLALYLKVKDMNVVEGVDLLMGQNSFPSGHTTLAFSLFTLVAFWNVDKKWLVFGAFGIAVMVGLSRVYLMQHFFTDVYVGSILGVLIALLVFFLVQKINSKIPEQPV